MASLSDRPTHLSGEPPDLAVRLTHTTDLDQLNLLSSTTGRGAGPVLRGKGNDAEGSKRDANIQGFCQFHLH